MVSVVIPYKQHSAWLDECLAHLERQTYRAFEVILVPDGEDAVRAANVRVLAARPGLPNHKRLTAAQHTNSPILAFIDDDAYPDPGWLAAAVVHFTDPTVVAAGGPSVTPPGDSDRRRASGAVYASPLVTAGTRFRYVSEHARDVEALPSCNLLIRRDAFVRDIERSLSYWPGEDILVCLAATAAGGRIVYDPNALVYHHRRSLFGGHLRQVWAYAIFRGFFLRRLHRSRRTAVYVVPALFVLANAAALVALSRARLRLPVAVAAGAYALAVAVSARREARTQRVNPWAVAVGIYLTHLTYGAGSIIGWFQRDISHKR